MEGNCPVSATYRRTSGHPDHGGGCDRSVSCKIKNRNIATNTLAKYRTFTNQLLAYVADRGCVYIDQLTVSDMDRFYASWRDGIRAKAKKLERLKAFTKFCLKREWLAKDISDDLQAPEGSSVTVPKSPSLMKNSNGYMPPATTSVLN